MVKVFISYKHDDQESKNAVDSIRQNLNNSIHFYDTSLQEPVCNSYGDINRRSPHDVASNLVNDEILKLIKESDKFLALIGENTHSSEWVNWEVKQFRKLKPDNNILLMRIPQGIRGGLPLAAEGLKVYDWNMGVLEKFTRN